MRWLLLALLVIPALEIGLFIWLGGITGPWWIVFLIILTGIIGVSLAKRQGMDTWQKAQLQMSKGIPPTEEILDGICIFIGAVFLFSPGFITDTVGFILVLPFTRTPLKRIIRKLINKMMGNGTIIYRKW
ncbi:FxsA family protein [Oceanobacillus saliphilus]|uniref:FxsA family protein n=1 Tax=Oceanobacillus saliphilus TaxID=2925834 RepID=UPI00201E3D08|nr:FxsA family protein [Oceanobacillus saliphilus]